MARGKKHAAVSRQGGDSAVVLEDDLSGLDINDPAGSTGADRQVAAVRVGGGNTKDRPVVAPTGGYVGDRDRGSGEWIDESHFEAKVLAEPRGRPRHWFAEIDEHGQGRGIERHWTAEEDRSVEFLAAGGVVNDEAAVGTANVRRVEQLCASEEGEDGASIGCEASCEKQSVRGRLCAPQRLRSTDPPHFEALVKTSQDQSVPSRAHAPVTDVGQRGIPGWNGGLKDHSMTLKCLVGRAQGGRLRLALQCLCGQQ